MSNHPNRGARPSDRPCLNPTGAEVRAAQKSAGLSHEQCAELVCVSAVTWMKWHSGAMVMPCGAWKLFRYEVGLLVPPDHRDLPASYRGA